MKKLWQRYKVDLIVCGLVTLSLQYAGKLIEALPSAGNSFLSAWVDSIYRQAALTTEYKFAIIVGMFGVGILLISLFATTYSNIKEIKDAIHISKRIEKITSGNDMESSNDKPKLTPIEENIQQELENLKQESKKNSSRCKRKLVVYLIINIYALGAFSTILLYPIILYDSFVANIQVIHPYISETEYVQIQSDWRRMKTKEDFDKINEYITQIKDENDLW
jgi:hypothetical protein